MRGVSRESLSIGLLVLSAALCGVGVPHLGSAVPGASGTMWGRAEAHSVRLEPGAHLALLPRRTPPASAPSTVEAWVRALSGACGPLLNLEGQGGWSLDLCGTLGLRTASGAQVRGIRRWDDGWHHVAVVAVEPDRVLVYVDGEVDGGLGQRRHSASGTSAEPGPPAHAGSAPPATPARAEGSPRLLLGSTEERGGFDGLVAGVRWWSEALGRQEVLATMNEEPGVAAALLGSWPVPGSVRATTRVLGGQPRGSAETPGRHSPAPLPAATPVPVPSRPAAAPWSGVLYGGGAPGKVDGACTAAEYPLGTRVPLGGMDSPLLRLRRDGPDVLLCAGPFLGDRARSTVALTIADGKEEAIYIEVNGLAQARRKEGRPGGVPKVAVVSAQRWRLQDDMGPVEGRAWSMEARVPVPGWEQEPRDPRLSVRLDIADEGGGSRVAAWPAAAKDDPRSSTRAVVLGSEPPPTEHVGRDPDDAAGVTHYASKSSPTLAQANAACTIDGILCDGSIADSACLPLMYDVEAKWPKVDPDAALTRGEGWVQEVKVSTLDSEWMHETHDLDMPFLPAPGYEWLLLSGANTMPIETESGEVPPSAWPFEGDHLTVYGRWIFDCGHEAKTELHPVVLLARDRPGWRQTPGTVHLSPVTEVDLHFNSDPGGFSYDFPEGFTFRFDVPLPDHGGASGKARLPYYVVEERETDPLSDAMVGALGKLDATLHDDVLQFSYTVPPGTWRGNERLRIVAGNLVELAEKAPDPSSAPAPGDGRVFTFDTLTIRQDDLSMEPWLSTVGVGGHWTWLVWGQSTRDLFMGEMLQMTFGILSGDPGLSNPSVVHLNRSIPWYPEDRYDDLTTVATSGYQQVALPDRELSDLANPLNWPGYIYANLWDLIDYTTEGDGVEALSLSASASAATAVIPSADPLVFDRSGNDGGHLRFDLHWSVMPYPFAKAVAPDALLSDLADEPSCGPSFVSSSTCPLESESIQVPIGGEGLWLLPDRRFVVGPLSYADASGRTVEVVGEDSEGIELRFDDFAEVSLTLSGSQDWTPAVVASMPEPWQVGGVSVNGVVSGGVRGSFRHVWDFTRGALPPGAWHYSAAVRYRWATLPPDWGEDDDRAGRVVDLLAPTAEESIGEAHLGHTYPIRERALPEAWFHTVGDVDHYRVEVPKEPHATREPLLASLACPYDEPATLTLDAPGALLEVEGWPATGVSTLSVPTAKLSESTVPVQVRSPDGHRHLYTLDVRWSGAVRYDRRECDLIRAFFAVTEQVGTMELSDQEVHVLGTRITLPDPAPDGLAVRTRYAVRSGPDGGLAASLAAPAVMRLLTADGVLIAEGADTREGSGTALTVRGLEPGAVYVLETRGLRGAPRAKAAIVLQRAEGPAVRRGPRRRRRKEVNRRASRWGG